MKQDTETKKKSFWLTSQGFAAITFIGAVLYFLLVEHRAHLIGWLPFLIILACPLIHVFMHRGHGHGGHSTNGKEGDKLIRHEEGEK